MEFETQLMLYLREHQPDLVRQLQREGQLGAFISQHAAVAHQRLLDLCAGNAIADTDTNGRNMMAEIARGEMMAPFTPEDDRQGADAARQSDAFLRGERHIEVRVGDDDPGYQPVASEWDDPAAQAVADAWAGLDGRLDEFRASKGASGYWEGYMADAMALIDNLARRGWTLQRAATSFQPVELPAEPEPKSHVDTEPLRAEPTDKVAPNGIPPRLLAWLAVALWLSLTGVTWFLLPSWLDVAAEAFERAGDAALGLTALCLVVLLPACFVKPLRVWARRGFTWAAWGLAPAIWITAWIESYAFWGKLGATLGVAFLGFGVLPLAFVGALLHGKWLFLLQLLIFQAAWFGSIWTAVHLPRAGFATQPHLKAKVVAPNVFMG